MRRVHGIVPIWPREEIREHSDDAPKTAEELELQAPCEHASDASRSQPEQGSAEDALVSAGRSHFKIRESDKKSANDAQAVHASLAWPGIKNRGARMGLSMVSPQLSSSMAWT